MEESRLIEIETRLAHQDQLLIELNEVVSDQQTQLMRLEDLCAVLIERMRLLAEAGSGDGGSGDGAQDERPPHY
jgi:SlyX protein